MLNMLIKHLQDQSTLNIIDNICRSCVCVGRVHVYKVWPGHVNDTFDDDQESALADLCIIRAI